MAAASNCDDGKRARREIQRACGPQKRRQEENGGVERLDGRATVEPARRDQETESNKPHD